MTQTCQRPNQSRIGPLKATMVVITEIVAVFVAVCAERFIESRDPKEVLLLEAVCKDDD